MQTLRVLFKPTHSPPSRYENCFKIYPNGELKIHCNPGIEIDVLLFLAEAIKVDLSWISFDDAGYEELETGIGDIIGNLKGAIHRSHKQCVI